MAKKMILGCIGIYFLWLLTIDFQDVILFSPSRMQYKKVSAFSMFGPQKLILLKFELRFYDHPLKKILQYNNIENDQMDWELSAYSRPKSPILPLFFHEIYLDLPSYSTSDVKEVGSFIEWEKLDSSDIEVKAFFEEIKSLFAKREYEIILKKLSPFLIKMKRKEKR